MAKPAKETTEIAVVENTKLAELAQKSGVELTKAEEHVSAFHPSLKDLAEFSRPLAGLDKVNPTPEHAKIARENRLKIVKIRTGAEGIKDDRKKVVLAEGNLVQSAFNLVKDACILTEAEYEEIEKHQERVEAKRREDLKVTRIELLAPYETDTEFLPLDIMDEEKFQALLAKEKEAFEAVKKAREQAEIERVAAEQKAELERLAEIEAEKVRQAERDAENERLKKEAEIREAELVKERAEQAKQLESERAEAARIAAEKQAEIDKANAESERIRKELEAKQLEEEKERLRIIAEQEEKEAAEKAKLLAPDKEKINALFISIRDFAFPECSTQEAKQIIADVQEGMKIILQGIKDKSKTLK